MPIPSNTNIYCYGIDERGKQVLIKTKSLMSTKATASRMGFKKFKIVEEIWQDNSLNLIGVLYTNYIKNKKWEVVDTITTFDNNIWTPIKEI